MNAASFQDNPSAHRYEAIVLFTHTEVLPRGSEGSNPLARDISFSLKGVVDCRAQSADVHFDRVGVRAE